jgi:hypothetical protein
MSMCKLICAVCACSCGSVRCKACMHVSLGGTFVSNVAERL